MSGDVSLTGVTNDSLITRGEGRRRRRSSDVTEDETNPSDSTKLTGTSSQTMTASERRKSVRFVPSEDSVEGGSNSAGLFVDEENGEKKSTDAMSMGPSAVSANTVPTPSNKGKTYNTDGSPDISSTSRKAHRNSENNNKERERERRLREREKERSEREKERRERERLRSLSRRPLRARAR